MQDETFVKSRGVERPSASSRDLARFCAKNAERCKTIEDEGYDPDDLTLKKWPVRWFECMTCDADLHAAYAKGMSEMSSEDYGSPWRVYESLQGQAQNMATVSEKLTVTDAAADISKY
ncbi:hypothetical protein TWF694_011482 [Orbilia ellipsospora]|uniref:Uncharacterized protein n=1 Tax=Orbilia ellipsospora TaxID=2528407 RepID=A0AAV9X6G8_9PEZI